MFKWGRIPKNAVDRQPCVYFTINYNNQQLLSEHIDCSLIEAWDNSTGVSRIVEGPKYYRGRFKTDNEILGDSMGLNEESLKEVFGLE